MPDIFEDGDELEFKVEEQYDGMSVNHFLRRHCGVSARLLAKLKRTENGITRSGAAIRSIDILHSGDIVCLTMPDDTNEIIPVNIPVEIVFEDEWIIVFNKPPYMPVHPVHTHQYDTLANAAAYYSRSKGETYAFRAVNRLDRDTSGLVLCAKNSYAATFLSRNTNKVYTALCEGILCGSGTINKAIRLKEGHTMQRETADDGVNAITHYQVLRSEQNHTLAEFRLETGRTHQIRVHMSSIGHPLAGDDMYGGSTRYFDRQCLHCSELALIHPYTKEKLCIVNKGEDWLAELKNKIGKIGSENF